ncbi:hypothetical protein KIH87_00755 [Paraneptunicella aestuarii]|uniref:hypothetical protein n=1 Tax=Paraneptunicella aestuarii TaxID=2831148 RepID=UPI001E54BB71|nr:hypothetical protein [Paraneptunicella aestuarii]UAA38937.1 hypothetical protein KIH87_00755 [Paraneptunicella aestuarii]
MEQSEALQIVLKLLDWPFLLFILVSTLIYVTRRQIRNLVDRSNLKITWGDRSIELSDLADNLDQDLDPIKERLDALEEQMKTMGKTTPDKEKFTQKEPTELEIDKVLNVALKNPRFKYRTLDGIAKDVKIPKDKVQQILGSNPQVQVLKARDGRQLYAAFDKPAQLDK